MGRDLFYCDTAYQILNVINIITSGKSSDLRDIIVYHQFSGSLGIVDRIKNIGIFDNVYEVFPDSLNAIHMPTKLYEAYQLTFCKHFIRRLRFKYQKYNTFYCSTLDTNTSLALYSTVDFDHLILYDDGLGSYNGNIILDHMSPKRSTILKLFHPFKKYFKIDKLLVYNPTMCKSTICNYIEKLDFCISEEALQVFLYKENSIYIKKSILIEQPYREANANKRVNLDRKLKDAIEKSGELEKYLIRLHPRMASSNVSGVTIDNINNLWEFECINQIDNDNVLISINSTASFQPTIVANKAPKMIFLYELYKSILSETEYTMITDYLERFRTCYPLIDIYVPRDWEELEIILESLKFSRGN